MAQMTNVNTLCPPPKSSSWTEAPSSGINVKLGGKCQCRFKEIELRSQAVAQALSRGATFPDGLRHSPFGSGTGPREKGGKLARALKQRLEPLVGPSLEMADEFQ